MLCGSLLDIYAVVSVETQWESFHTSFVFELAEFGLQVLVGCRPVIVARASKSLPAQQSHQGRETISSIPRNVSYTNLLPAHVAKSFNVFSCPTPRQVFYSVPQIRIGLGQRRPNPGQYVDLASM